MVKIVHLIVYVFLLHFIVTYIAICCYCAILQVLPLLMEKFSFEEQASLVWQFLCSIPVNMMAEFLPWLSSSISADECKDMHKFLHKVIPDEELLQEVS